MQVSLGSVAITLALILALGIVIGGAAGFVGGRADQFIMRVTDVFLTFPTLILALFMVGMLGTGLTNVILAIALSHWAWYARIVRGIVMSLRHRDFLLAARMSGAGPIRTFVEHLLPATFSQLVVLATLVAVGAAFLAVQAKPVTYTATAEVVVSPTQTDTNPIQPDMGTERAIARSPVRTRLARSSATYEA